MSDLAATNCGCNTSDNGGCCNIIWTILLLSCFCGNGGSPFNNNGCGGNDSCWIIILLLLCGGGCGCGNGIF